MGGPWEGGLLGEFNFGNPPTLETPPPVPRYHVVCLYTHEIQSTIPSGQRLFGSAEGDPDWL